MTSIYDIPYEDIKIFLKANGKLSTHKDDDYEIAKDLLNDKNAKGHTTSIIEWIIAHNLLINNINIPYYTSIEIDDMNQNEINDLAKLLTMKRNNRENIKNILRYLHKLNLFALPELNDIIFSNLTRLELDDINISKLKYKDVIKLLKTHRNKTAIRKIIYDNLEKIIVYNSIYIDFDEFDDISEELDYFLDKVTIYNKNIMREIMIDNMHKLKKIYNDKLIKNILQKINNNDNNHDGEVYIGKSEMYDLVRFTFDLINENEKILAKKVFDIANDLHYFGRSYSYNYDLVDFSLLKESQVLKTIIDFMGEDEFIENYLIIDDDFRNEHQYDFFKELVVLKKYDLLVKIIEMYIKQNYKSRGKMIVKTLQIIKRGIKSNDDELVLKYLQYV